MTCLVDETVESRVEDDYLAVAVLTPADKMDNRVLAVIHGTTIRHEMRSRNVRCFCWRRVAPLSTLSIVLLLSPP